MQRFEYALRATIALVWVLLPTPAWTQEAAPVGAAQPYPRAELLVEPQVVRTGRRDLVILDVRSEADYQRGHVPGAVRVDHDAWKGAFQEGNDAQGWSQRIGGLGIGPQTQVIVYDDAMSKDAARIWWMLRYWGVEKAALIHGGWRGWQASGRTIETKSAAPRAEKFEAVPRRQTLTLTDALRKQVGNPGAAPQIVDARSEAEFCGKDTRSARRSGAMPGAKHLEWSNLIDRKTHRFKPTADLKKLFADAGIDPTKRTVTHCQSGGRSSVMAFGLELMRAGDVSNYYAGWAEWGNSDDTPIVKPPAR